MSTPATAGVATGIGSWPGVDLREAAATVIGELPLMPHLVELPARGLGAEAVGRTGAMLVELELDVATSAYRLSAGRSRAGRLAADYLAEDVDVLEELWETAGLRGTDRVVKVSAVGPFTLAAEVELANGHRALTDLGAVRDIVGSLAEGVAQHADDVAKRLGVDVVVQLDEPSIGAVLGGTLLGVTSLEQVRAVRAPDMVAALDEVIARIGRPVIVHSCGRDVPFEVFERTAVSAVSFDLSLLIPKRYDAVGELLQSGRTLMLGVAPTSEPSPIPTWRDIAAPAIELVDRLGFSRSVLRDQVSVTPTCGLAGTSLSWARAALTVLSDVQRAFADEPESL